MKKTKAFVIAVAVALGMSSSVYAKLPPRYILIGNKGYHVSYIATHVKELNDILTSNSLGGVYYVDDDSNIKSLFDAKNIDESTLKDKIGSNNITLIDETGNRHAYNIEGSEYNNQKFVIDVKVKVTAVAGGLKLVNIKVIQPEGNFFPEYENKCFKVDESGSIKKLSPRSGVEGESIDDYQITLVTPNTSESLNILTGDGNTIGRGNFTIPNPDTGASVETTVPITLTITNSSETNSVNNGNVASNVNHNGLVAQNNNVDVNGKYKSEDKWIYYSNTSDGGKLYKKNLSGFDDYKISEDNAKFINVVGDWIYYSNYSDGGKLYKVQTDGTKKRKVCDDRVSFINVAGDYIYYSNHSDKGKIYKVNKNSAKLKSTETTKVTDDEATFINVSGDIIYYSNGSDKNKLYSVHLDGTYRTKLVDVPVKYVTFKDDFLYYITEQGYLNKVYKSGKNMAQKLNIKIDLQDKKGKITTTEDKIMGINIIGNNLYYWSKIDGNKLYKASALDTYDIKATKYSNDSVDSINVINITGNDEVYYTKGGKIYRAYDPVDTVDKTGKKNTTYSSTVVAKPKTDLKIVSYDKKVSPLQPIVAIVDNIEDYLPDKVTAVMSDNSTRQLLINWDMSKPIGTNGKISFKGTIVGYGQTVTLDTVNNSKAPDPKFISVKNNAGKNDDTVQVVKLNLGDVVKVYRDAEKTQLLGTSTAVPAIGDQGPAKATVVLKGDNVIGDNDTKVFVTVTSQGLAESQVVKVDFANATPSKDILAEQVKIINIAENGIDNISISSGTGDAALKKDDIIKVYRVQNDSRVYLVPQQVTPDNNPFEGDRKYTCNIQLAGSNALGNDSGKVIITRTSTDGAESSGVEVTYEKGKAPELEGYSESTINDMSGRKVSLNLNTIELLNDNYKLYYKVSDSNNSEMLRYGDVINSVESNTSGWTMYDPKVSIDVLKKQYIYVAKTYNGKILSYGVRQAVMADDDTLNVDTGKAVDVATTTSSIDGNNVKDIVGNNKQITLTYALGEDYAAGGSVVFRLPTSWILSNGSVTAKLNGTTSLNTVISGTEVTVNLPSGAKAKDAVSINFVKDITEPQMLTFYGKGNATKDSNGNPLSFSRIVETQLNVQNIAPNAVLAKGTTAGTTKITGLQANKTYEYVISDTVINESNNLWDKPITVTSLDTVDNIKINPNQYINIREKAASGVPASLINSIQVLGAVIQ